MKSRLRQHHHGNEIRVDAAYITLPGSDKTELGATATISRDGATVGHRAELIQARITEFGAVVQARGPDLREVLAEERKGARRAR